VVVTESGRTLGAITDVVANPAQISGWPSTSRERRSWSRDREVVVDVDVAAGRVLVETSPASRRPTIPHVVRVTSDTVTG
jgi:hypothetical protein